MPNREEQCVFRVPISHSTAIVELLVPITIVISAVNERILTHDIMLSKMMRGLSGPLQVATLVDCLCIYTHSSLHVACSFISDIGHSTAPLSINYVQ